MTYKIVQMGNSHTNSSSRDGHVPTAIVDHISAGTMGSMDAWFTSAGNTVSSAHFGVSKKGDIHQYVDIRRMAWTQGVKVANIKHATAPFILEHPGTNPNKYCIGIEHEGTDGELTPAQFAATVWLHNFIRDEVKRIYGHTIALNNRYVLGHFQVDPVRKPFCPGPKFPWKDLYASLGAQVATPAKPVTEVKPPVIKVPSAVEVPMTWNGKDLSSKAINRSGATYVPARVLGELAGKTIGFKGGKVTVDGVAIADTIVEGTNGYARSTDFAKAIGYNVVWKNGKVNFTAK